jgi:hypothetical protein
VTTSPLLRLAAGCLVGAALLLAASDACAIEVGEAAPEVEVNDTFNCDSFSLRELRGRLILFELFSTG